MAVNKEIIQVNVKGARKAQGALKGIGSAALKMGAVFFAAKGVINGVKGSIDAFGQQELAMKKIETVLKSTNNASGITAKGYADMASELQRLTTFEDDAIMGAQSLMMTFTKVGKDVMPQAIETTLNMAEAMGIGLKEQTIQLGKALNDPILGISALSRVGVQLSEQQRASIKDFMAVGDVASAQGVILGELETQFGGMARGARDTLQGSIKAMKNALSDLGENVGEILAPAIRAGANLISGIAENAQEGFDFAKTVDWEGTFKNIKENSEVIWNTWTQTARLTMDILPDLMGDAIPQMLNHVIKALKWVASAVIGVAKDLWKPIGNAFETLIFDIGAGWDKFKMLTGQMFERFGANTKNTFIGVARSVIGTINDLAQKSNETLGTSFGTIKMPELIDTDKIAEDQTTAYDKLIENQETARQKMIDAQEGSEIVDFLSSMFMGTDDEDDLDTWEQYTDSLTQIYEDAAGKIIVVNDEIAKSSTTTTGTITTNNDKTGKSWADVTDKQRKSLGQAADQMVSDLKVMADSNDKYTKLYKTAAIARTIASTYESAQEQFKKFSTAYAAPLGQILGGIAAAAAVGAGLVKVENIRKAQYGADFITDGPQMMLVGDNAGGREHVSVTPLGTPNLDGPQGQGVTLNISGNVLHESFIEDSVIPQIREGLRLGENMGI